MWRKDETYKLEYYLYNPIMPKIYAASSTHPVISTRSHTMIKMQCVRVIPQTSIFSFSDNMRIFGFTHTFPKYLVACFYDYGLTIVVSFLNWLLFIPVWILIASFTFVSSCTAHSCLSQVWLMIFGDKGEKYK